MVGVLGDQRLYAFTGGQPPTLDELRARYRRLAVGRSADGSEEWHNWIVRRRSDVDALGSGPPQLPWAMLQIVQYCVRSRRGCSRTVRMAKAMSSGLR